MILTFGIINVNSFSLCHLTFRVQDYSRCSFLLRQTFSMRHSNGWSMKDLQHTACAFYLFLDSSIVSQTDTSVPTVGVLWWAGGALGVFMSMGGKRHWVPAMVCVHSSSSSDPSITAD
jgi:hypothetical protein